MRSKRSLMGVALVVAACLVLPVGFVCLYSVGDKVQYVLSASAARENENGLTQAYEQAWQILANMGDMLDSPTVAARAQRRSIQRAESSVYVDATIYAVGEGYFDLEHNRLLDGRLISPYDISNAQQVMLVSSRAAIRMFQSESPVGKDVVFGEKLYRVIGVVEGGKRIGETDECVAYVPITTTDKIKMDTLEISAKDTGTLSAAVFENTLTAWNGGGTFYRFEKLKMGAWIPLRWVLVLLAMKLMMGCGAGILRFGKNSACAIRERLKHDYMGKVIPETLSRCVLGAMICAVFAGMAYGIALAASQPLYVFGEWVPSVFVDLSSILETFWNLNLRNAVSIRYLSRDVCQLELAQGLIRWGTGCLAVGVMFSLLRIEERKRSS